MTWFNEAFIAQIEEKSSNQDEQKVCLDKSFSFAEDKYWEEMEELRDALTEVLDSKKISENLHEELGDFLFCTLLDSTHRERLEERLSFDFDRMGEYLKRDELAIRLLEMQLPDLSNEVQSYKYTQGGWVKKTEAKVIKSPKPVLENPKQIPYLFAPDKKLAAFDTRDGTFKYRVDCNYLGGGFVEYVDNFSEIEVSMSAGPMIETTVTTCWLTADEIRARKN